MSLTLNYHNLSKNNNFNLIRFFAALFVIYSHSFDITGHQSVEPLKIFSNNYISIGTLSVYIFFIISGFLIQQSYDRAHSLSRYLFFRIIRIFPALTIVIIVSVFIIGPLLTTFSIFEYFTSYETYKYLLNCFSIKLSFYLPGVFENNMTGSSVNTSIWTLPVEIMFYCLIAFFGQIKIRKFKQALFILLYILLLWISIGFDKASVLLHNVMFFVVGIFFYKFRYNIRLTPLFFVLSFLIFIFSLQLPGYMVVIPFVKYLRTIIFTLALSYIIITTAYIRNSLITFAKHGDYSYGLYIWAWPVQQILAYYFPMMSQLSNFILGAFFVFPLAFISWNFIEKKYLRLKEVYFLKYFANMKAKVVHV